MQRFLVITAMHVHLGLHSLQSAFAGSASGAAGTRTSNRFRLRCCFIPGSFIGLLGQIGATGASSSLKHNPHHFHLTFLLLPVQKHEQGRNYPWIAIKTNASRVNGTIIRYAKHIIVERNAANVNKMGN
jgi:hypothetical protein